MTKLSMFTDFWNRNTDVQTPAGFSIETTEVKGPVVFGGSPEDEPDMVSRVNTFS
jgi:hypothetical protein